MTNFARQPVTVDFDTNSDFFKGYLQGKKDDHSNTLVIRTVRDVTFVEDEDDGFVTATGTVKLKGIEFNVESFFQLCDATMEGVQEKAAIYGWYVK